MKHNCPIFTCNSTHIVYDGTYFRKCDSRHIQRLLCTECGKKFSYAIYSTAYNQKKRRVNYQIYKLLAAGNSLNQIAKLENVNRKTVARKLVYLGKLCQMKNLEIASELKGQINEVEFDELITHEHTKCKPLSIAVAVEKYSRYIMGFQVSKIPANGRLAKISVAKYGKRPNHRERGLNRMFNEIKPLTNDNTRWNSDEYPTYRKELCKVIGKEISHIPEQFLPKMKAEKNPKKQQKQSEVFPINYRQFKGIKGCITGQGELKKTVFDPLFTINQTLAMLRAKINRLFRRTWNTTKKIEGLENHLHIYVHYHNTRIVKWN